MNPIIKYLGMVAGGVIGFILIQKNKIKEADEEHEYFQRYDGLFRLHALLNGIPNWRWLKAIAKQESDLGRDARTSQGRVSYDGLSYGLMQIAAGTGSAKEIEIKGYPKRLTEISEPEKLLIKSELNDPNISIDKAAKLVAYLYRKYGNKDKVFLAYNQGEQNTDRGKNYTHPNGQYAILINKHLNWIEQKEREYGL